MAIEEWLNVSPQAGSGGKGVNIDAGSNIFSGLSRSGTLTVRSESGIQKLVTILQNKGYMDVVILRNKSGEGVEYSINGGEYTRNSASLIALLNEAKTAGSKKPVLLFSIDNCSEGLQAPLVVKVMPDSGDSYTLLGPLSGWNNSGTMKFTQTYFHVKTSVITAEGMMIN